MAHRNAMPRMMMDGEDSMRRRVIELSHLHDATEIAEIANVPLGMVRSILDAIPPSEMWWLRNNRTGRCWTRLRSDRGAYRLVCLLGLTDWDWGLGNAPGERAQP